LAKYINVCVQKCPNNDLLIFIDTVKHYHMNKNGGFIEYKLFD